MLNTFLEIKKYFVAWKLTKTGNEQSTELKPPGTYFYPKR